jgi:hypothetical protein
MEAGGRREDRAGGLHILLVFDVGHVCRVAAPTVRHLGFTALNLHGWLREGQGVDWETTDFHSLDRVPSSSA